MKNLIAVALATALLAPAVHPLAAQAEITLDTSFGVNGVTRTAFGTNNSDEPRDLLIQPDGMILTAGKSTAYTGDNYIAISRHSADGVLDSTGFGVDGKIRTSFHFRDRANGIALQEDGKIVAAGMAMTSTGVSTQRPTVCRFHGDGSADATFGNDGYVEEWGDYLTGEFAGAKVLPDGSILVGGRRHPGYWGGITGFWMRRYLSDGTLMSGNTLEFPALNRSQGSCAFPADGGILVANLANFNGRFEFVMGRVDSAMNPVAGFGTNGIVQTGVEAVMWVNPRVLVLPDGKILLVGTTPRAGGGENSNWTALRFLADGTPDDSFGINGRTDVSFYTRDRCYDAAIDGDGRILLAGESGYGQPALARLLPDGSLDATFSDDGKFTIDLNGAGGTHYFTRVLLRPGGKILAAGFDYSSNGGDFFLARFNARTRWAIRFDGSLGAAEGGVALASAYPNPSRDETTIRLSLPRADHVRVEIFDAAGRSVRRVLDGALPSGAHAVRWDGLDMRGAATPAGVFFARVSTSAGEETEKLIRIR